MGYWHGYAFGTLECGSNDLHMVQLMPLPPIISCFSKFQNGLPFWCRLTQDVLEKRPLYVCVCNSLEKKTNETFNRAGEQNAGHENGSALTGFIVFYFTSWPIPNLSCHARVKALA